MIAKGKVGASAVVASNPGSLSWREPGFEATAVEDIDSA